MSWAGRTSKQTGDNNAAIIASPRVVTGAATVAVCCSPSTVSPSSRSFTSHYALYCFRRSTESVHSFSWPRSATPNNPGTPLPTPPHINIGSTSRKVRTQRLLTTTSSTNTQFRSTRTHHIKPTTSILRRLQCPIHPMAIHTSPRRHPAQVMLSGKILRAPARTRMIGHIRHPQRRRRRKQRHHFGKWYVTSGLSPGVRSLQFSQFIPNSIACRLYLLTVLVETTIDLAIESDLLVRFHQVNEGKDVVSKKMPVYLTIFALAQCVTS